MNFAFLNPRVWLRDWLNKPSEAEREREQIQTQRLQQAQHKQMQQPAQAVRTREIITAAYEAASYAPFDKARLSTDKEGIGSIIAADHLAQCAEPSDFEQCLQQKREALDQSLRECEHAIKAAAEVINRVCQDRA